MLSGTICKCGGSVVHVFRGSTVLAVALTCLAIPRHPWAQLGVCKGQAIGQNLGQAPA